MEKEHIKKILYDMIDAADGIEDFSISSDLDEIDISTLGKEWIERRPTGRETICITVYRRN